MKICKTKDLRKALLAKGFVAVDTHHEMFWFFAGDKKTSIRTRISQGASEYGTGLVGEVAKQLKLSRNELGRFVDCALTGEAYLTRLINARHVTLDEPPKDKDEPKKQS